MTLYRKTGDTNRDRLVKPHPDAFWSDKYGWLEEVEPDIEAAARELRETAGWIGVDAWDAMDYKTREHWLRRTESIIGTALGKETI